MLDIVPLAMNADVKYQVPLKLSEGFNSLALRHFKTQESNDYR